MKKFTLILILCYTQIAFAQKDIEVTLVKPDTNSTIYNGEEFDMFIQLKNVGQTDIPATDSVDIGVFIDGTLYGALNINSHFHGLTANQSDIWQIPVTLSITDRSDNAEFCVVAALYKNGIILDMNESNDKGCQVVSLSPFSVGVAEASTASPSVQLFPNPANNELHISIENTIIGNAIFTLSDITGKELKTLSFENGSMVLNTTDMNNGIYFYRIQQDGKLLRSGKIAIVH